MSPDPNDDVASEADPGDDPAEGEAGTVPTDGPEGGETGTDPGDVDPEADGTAESLADRRGTNTTVYQPAEDSGLLADAAVEFARGRTLEVGTGSGWVAAKVDVETDADVVASDVNPHACRSARERGVESVRADLLSPFRAGAFETVLFNPPYLPTDPDHEWDDWMEDALSGGETGRSVIEPFLKDVGRVLKTNGQVLLLVSSLTGYDEVVSLAETRGFDVEAVREESYPFEALSILRLTPRRFCG